MKLLLDECVSALAAATLREAGYDVRARGKRHVGIVRLVDSSFRVQAAECIAVLERYRERLPAGALIVASPGNVRVRLIRLLGDAGVPS